MLTFLRKLPEKYQYWFIALLLLLVAIGSRAQTYNPSNFTVSNKSYGPAQAVSTDARSWFYDASNFVMRDYNGTTEVLSYLNLAKFRSGHFPVYVHSGGTLGGNGVWVGGITLVYWFKDSTGDANLVRWYTDSTGNPGGPFFAVANHLSEGNAGLIKGTLSLDNVDNTSDATKNAAAVSLTNHTIDGLLNTLLNIPNSALVHNSIGLTINHNTGSDIAVTTTPAALGASLVFNVPDAGISSRGALTAANWNFFFNKLDSVHVSNDSVYNCINGTCVLQSVLSTAGFQSLTLNPRGDSLGITGTNIVPVAPDRRNDGWFFRQNVKNMPAAAGFIVDTGGLTSLTDTVHMGIGLFGNSMMEHLNLMQQHIIEFLAPRMPSAGYGFVSVAGNEYNLIFNAPAAEWTLLNAFSTPKGRGIDTYELASTGATGDTIEINVSTNLRSLTYLQWNHTEVWYYAAPGNGSFRTLIDGVDKGVTNTAIGTGPQRAFFTGLANTSHHVQVVPVTEGTGHIHILGFNLYQEATRGWIVNKAAKGASTVQNFTALNQVEWQKMVGWLRLTTGMFDWVVTSAGVMDTLTYQKSLDTILVRVRNVDSTIDRIIFGPTPFSTTLYGVPVSPLDAFERSLKRHAQDSLCGFWSPFALYGRDIVEAVIRNIIGSDSLHRTGQGSQAEVAQLLGDIGILANTLPIPDSSFYRFNGRFPDDRDVDGQDHHLKFNNLTTFGIGGTSGNPQILFGLGDPLQIAVTAGTPWLFDANIATSGVFVSTGNNINEFSGALTVGGTTLASARTFQVNNTLYAIARATTTGANGAGVWEAETTDGLNGVFASVGNSRISDVQEAHSTSLLGNFGNLNLAAVNASAVMRFFVGNNADAAEAMRIANDRSLLLNTTTADASSLLTMVSTTKGFLPPRMTQSQFNSIGSKATSLHAVLTDSSGRMALYNGSKILTYATSDQLIGYGTAPAAGSLGTNVSSATIQTGGSDRYVQVVVVTSGAVSGTLFQLTLSSAFGNNPVAIISAGDDVTGAAVAATSGGYLAAQSTSASVIAVKGQITSAGTYVLNLFIGGK